VERLELDDIVHHLMSADIFDLIADPSGLVEFDNAPMGKRR
jgi:hypothetical protein